MDITTYGPVPLASRQYHVNGRADVAFDTVNTVDYLRSYSLEGASYDSTTKTCSSIPCHYNNPPLTNSAARWQSKPKWGNPYRGWTYESECDLCHRYGYLGPTCTTP